MRGRERPCHPGASALQVGPSPAPCPSHPVEPSTREEDAQALPLQALPYAGLSAPQQPWGGGRKAQGPPGLTASEEMRGRLPLSRALVLRPPPSDLASCF